MELTLDMTAASLSSYLQDQKLLNEADQIVHIEKPGEGNMNVVLRIVSNERRMILKQSRPYVNKYPQIAAPSNRIDIERQFYNTVKSIPALQEKLPRIQGYMEADRMLVLEDLGDAKDYTYLYQQGQHFSTEEIQHATSFLHDLHGYAFDRLTIDAFPLNMEMRQLNHEHIFIYPFLSNNGLDLDTITPGLAHVASKYQDNGRLQAVAKDLGRLYLTNGGPHLLHGDYFPGSWLATSDGFKVIDPEFCFFGPAEFDVGVMTAHLDMARQTYDTDTILSGHPCELDATLVGRFRSIEIMRRLIGLAQLPVTLSLEEKSELLAGAYNLLMA